MARNFQEAYKMLDAASTAVTGLAMDIAAFKTMVLEIDTANSANFTLKVQGSLATVKPDFTAASTPANPWTYLQAIDLADQSVVNGATGIVATGTDIHRQLEVNTNGQKWVCVTITAISAGNVTVLGMPFNDNE